MRDYEFRGRDKYGQWHYGSLLINDHRTAQKDIFDIQYYIYTTKYYIYTTTGSFLIEPGTIGQYIGKKDAHGNKIFTGDMVCVDDMFWEIYYDNEDACYYLRNVRHTLSMDFVSFYDSELEIQGNIHDNPELLKEE